MSDETPQGPPGGAPSPWQVPPAQPPGGLPSAPPPPPWAGYAGAGAPPPYPSGGYGPGMAAGPNGTSLANYGLRLGGFLIDAVLLWIVLALILWPLHAYRRIHSTANVHQMTLHANGFGIVVPALAVILYGMFLCGSARGQTIGMMIVRVRVVDANSGGPIGMARALGRGAFEWLLGIVVIPWVVDMLFPLWDQRRQTLHDKVTNAVVIRV